KQQANSGSVEQLGILAGLLSQSVALALLGGVVIGGYVLLAERGVIGGSTTAGLALVSCLVVGTDLAAERVAESPVEILAAVIAVVLLLPLLVAVVLLQRDTTIVRAILSSVLSGSDLFAELVLSDSTGG
ncbi:MAG: hypothetical protein ABEI99_08500, partial [Halobaculum sp.]